MSSQNEKTHLPPLDLSLWSKLPAGLMAVGGVLCVAGAGIDDEISADGACGLWSAS